VSVGCHALLEALRICPEIIVATDHAISPRTGGNSTNSRTALVEEVDQLLTVLDESNGVRYGRLLQSQ
jgi:hypothetical protein